MTPSEQQIRFDYDLRLSSSLITLLIFCIGILGNCLVIFIIAISKDFKKSVTHWYVLQLAIADTIFLLTLPFNASQTINQEWIYSEGLCKVKEAVLYINYYASIMFLMIMSMDRYIAVCHSLSNFTNNLRKHVAAYTITAVIWAIAILLSIPVLMYTKKIGLDPHCTCRIDFPDFTKLEKCLEQAGGHDFLIEECYNHESCVSSDFSGDFSDYFSGIGSGNLSSGNLSSHSGETEQSDYNGTRNENDDGFIVSGYCTHSGQPIGWYIFLWLNFSIMFLLPFSVMGICYGLIIHHLIESSSSIKSSRADQDRRRITMLCIILVSAFAGCWVMFHAVHIAKIYNIYQSAEVCRVLTSFSVWLVYLNSALNPYLYTFLGTGFSKKWQTIKMTPIVQSMITLRSRAATTTDGRSRSKTGDQSSASNANSNDKSLLQSNAHSSTNENTKQAVYENNVPLTDASVN